MSSVESSTDRIRKLNDLFRQTHRGGRVLFTSGVIALDVAIQRKIVRAVADFNRFTKDNDPHGEHDCAVIEVEGHRIIFKIDYYDLALTYGSVDSADPALTTRVMTIMLADEY